MSKSFRMDWNYNGISTDCQDIVQDNFIRTARSLGANQRCKGKYLETSPFMRRVF